MDSLFINFVILGAISSFIALVVVVTFSAASFAHHRRIEAVFTRIYKESEERIGNANLMVKQCTDSLKVQSETAKDMAGMLNNVTQVYADQISMLQKQRDHLTDENKELARAVNRLSDILALKKDQVINLNHNNNA